MREFGYTHDYMDSLTDNEIIELAAFINKEPVKDAMAYYMGQITRQLAILITVCGQSKKSWDKGPEHFVPWLDQTMPVHLMTDEEKAEHYKEQRLLADIKAYQFWRSTDSQSYEVKDLEDEIKKRNL